MSNQAHAIILFVSFGLTACTGTIGGFYEPSPSRPIAVVDEDITYFDGLLRQGIIDGIDRFTDSTGMPRFEFLLASQQSAANAFDERYFGHPFGVTDSETIIAHLNGVRRTDIPNPQPAALDPGGYYLNAAYLLQLADTWMQRPLDTGLFFHSNSDRVEIPDAPDLNRLALTVDQTGLH